MCVPRAFFPVQNFLGINFSFIRNIWNVERNCMLFIVNSTFAPSTTLQNWLKFCIYFEHDSFPVFMDRLNLSDSNGSAECYQCNHPQTPDPFWPIFFSLYFFCIWKFTIYVVFHRKSNESNDIIENSNKMKSICKLVTSIEIHCRVFNLF